VRRRRVLVFGAGGQAKIIVDALHLSSGDEPVGYVDDSRPPGTEWFGLPVLGPMADLGSIVEDHGIDAGIVSVGDNYRRGAVVDDVEAALPGFVWVNAIHPMVAIGKGCEIGVGVHMMAGAVVNPASIVGDHVHIDTRASLDHDSTLGRCASLGPTAATGGGCTIGEFTAVAIGAVVVHGTTIGAHTVVGAGATVLADLPDHVVAFGTPARVIRQRAPGERYL
jgi:sugar O-acyltransferase (sialic acid O-acetyltransferase NeuD family)